MKTDAKQKKSLSGGGMLFIAIAIPCLLIGLMFFVFSNARFANADYYDCTTQGTVVNIDVKRESKTYHKWIVSYAYEIDGIEYSKTEEFGKGIGQNLRVGGPIDILYNTTDRTYIWAGYSKDSYIRAANGMRTAAIVCFAISIFCIVMIFKTMKNKGSETESKSVIEKEFQ